MLIFSLSITILFALITWHRFDRGVFLLFALLPTYLIRFSIGPLPTTLLELLLLSTVSIGLLQYKDNIIPTCQSLWREHRWILIAATIFLIGVNIGMLTSINLREALGEWKAFYVEPVFLAITLLIAAKRNPNVPRAMLAGITTCATVAIVFTLWQVATGGTFVPDGFWQPDGSFRATGWYGFPNGIGIMLGLSFFPVLLYIGQQSKASWQYISLGIVYVVLTLAALLFARTTGALIGIAAGTGMLLLAHQRTRLMTLILGGIGVAIFALLPMAHPVKQELLLQDRSGQIRTHMWAETAELLKDRPLLGASMASYDERIEPYHTTVNGEGIEIFHHPHNIFLTMWVNTGLIGLIGFVLLLLACTIHLVRTQQWYLLAFFAAFVTMGLVDSPYIKNDWSVLVWAMVAFSLVPRQHEATPRP